MSPITYEELLSAFPAGPFPAATPICMPTCDDEGVEAFFREKIWAELSEADLRDHDFAPTIFTPEAFQHFLPAYLRWFYTTADHLDSLGESVIINLGAEVAYPVAPCGRAKFIYARLTDKQRRLVRQFVTDFVTVAGRCAVSVYSDAAALYCCEV